MCSRKSHELKVQKKRLPGAAGQRRGYDSNQIRIADRTGNASQYLILQYLNCMEPKGCPTPPEVTYQTFIKNQTPNFAFRKRAKQTGCVPPRTQPVCLLDKVVSEQSAFGAYLYDTKTLCSRDPNRYEHEAMRKAQRGNANAGSDA